PFAAQTNASAIPVLPDVDSMIVLRPGSIRPSASAASIIATPIRSLTEPPGLKASSLPITSASRPSPSRANRSIGVLPTSSDRLAGIPPLITTIGRTIAAARDTPRRPGASDCAGLLRSGALLLALLRDGHRDLLARP